MSCPALSRAQTGAGNEVKKGFHGLDVAQEPIVSGSEVQQFLLDTTDVSQAQDSATADRAPLGLYWTSGASG